MTDEKEELENETVDTTVDDLVNEEKAEKNIDSENTEENKYKEKYEDINDRYLRLYSEFENFRKRTAREKIDLIGNASERVIKEMIPVLDDLERAVLANQKLEDIDIIKEGTELVFHKFKHVLTTQGLKEMDSKEQDFDVEKHEAITKIPAPAKKLKGKVVDVIEKGYFLNDKVIRYAKVVIGE